MIRNALVSVALAVLCGGLAMGQNAPASAATAQAAQSATQPALPKEQPHEWWRGHYFTQTWNAPDGTKLPLISVKGNRFVDPTGQPMLFRGVNIADPDKVESEGHWNRELFEKVKATGANVVRIPVHPAAWRGRGPKEYLALLDQAVEWSTDLGIYVDIDWHSIGNLKEGVFESPIYETSLPETLNFWRTIAAHYRGNHTVAFFELFNEPSVAGGRFGTMTWEEWRDINEEMIGIIRAWNKDTIPLVAGLDWAYDLTGIRTSPIRADNIGYTAHPYPNKRTQPWPPKWEEDFGFAASKYPMIATEIGFDSGQYGPKELGIVYGHQITSYLESRGIGWTAWCFDPTWGPTMLKSWNYDLTDAGQLFSDVMHAPPTPLGGPVKQ
ncbi:MAG: cellulase family glycosylhydrolase [Terracidiphilus sp.]